ncbi:MAG: potassium channel protein [Acidimicrobiales bacterium]
MKSRVHRHPYPVALLVRRLANVFAVMVAVMTVATIGFVVLADYPWFDGLYMSVITLATIGYGEVNPLDTTGRVWAITVIVAGFATFVYAASVLSSVFVSGEFTNAVKARRGERMRQQLQGHVIVVGFGRVGRAVVKGVVNEQRPCIVIDRERTLDSSITEAGVVGLIGDASEESTLRDAGIERAEAIVVAAHDDATNLVVVLTARALNPQLRIVARVNDPAWYDRICRAGAHSALSPYESYGIALAASALDASVVGVQDLPTLGLRAQEFTVLGGSPIVGMSLADFALGHPDVLVVGIRREEGITRWHEIPGPINVDDVIVILGEPNAMARVASAVVPGD